MHAVPYSVSAVYTTVLVRVPPNTYPYRLVKLISHRRYGTALLYGRWRLTVEWYNKNMKVIIYRSKYNYLQTIDNNLKLRKCWFSRTTEVVLQDHQDPNGICRKPCTSNGYSIPPTWKNVFDSYSRTWNRLQTWRETILETYLEYWEYPAQVLKVMETEKLGLPTI